MLETKQNKNLKLLTPEQVAELVGCKRNTLASWRCRQKDPPYINVDRILYDQDDQFAWMDSHKVTHQSR